MRNMTQAALHVCQGCHFRRTKKDRCAPCAKREVSRLRDLEKRRAVRGTPPNLGAEAFLADLATPDGFAREDVREPQGWDPEPSFPAVQFVGHAGQTTVKVVIADVTSEWSVGSGHTAFTTCKGSFSFDRHGVEDSFYVQAEDTVAVVDTKVRDQIERVVAARARHEVSETVPFVGHVVTPARKAEIAAALRAGRTHNFTPSGFGTGYAVSAKPSGRFVRQAPPEMAAFFGVPRLYYETFDHD